MTKPLSRRLFIRAAAAAPVMAKQAVTAAVQQEAAAMTAAGVAFGPGLMGGPMPFGAHVLANPTLLGLFKAGLLPEWAKQDIAAAAREQARFLGTDVACLRSVSLSGKVAINLRRAEAQMQSEAVHNAMLAAARQAFWRDPANNCAY